MCLKVSKTKQFTTEVDNQEEVTIKIYQGESQFIHENFLIGEFILKDIPKQPRSVPVINVNISIDLNGLINITATDRKNFATSKLTIENKIKLSDNEIETIIENKKVNDQLYNDYIGMIDNFYLFRNYFEKINYNTNINCVNKMTDEEKLEITNEINEVNIYVCSIVNKFEYKLKLDINKYTNSFIEIKENDIKRLVELIKLKNDEIKSKYELLILNYNNNESLLNNNIDSVAEIDSNSKLVESNSKLVESNSKQANSLDEETNEPLLIIEEHDYSKEFYNLIEQLHINMNDFQIKDDAKIELIEFISNLIESNHEYEEKLNKLNNFVDNLIR